MGMELFPVLEDASDMTMSYNTVAISVRGGLCEVAGWLSCGRERDKNFERKIMTIIYRDLRARCHLYKSRSRKTHPCALSAFFSMFMYARSNTDCRDHGAQVRRERFALKACETVSNPGTQAQPMTDTRLKENNIIPIYLAI